MPDLPLLWWNEQGDLSSLLASDGQRIGAFAGKLKKVQRVRDQLNRGDDIRSVRDQIIVIEVQDLKGIGSSGEDVVLACGEDLAERIQLSFGNPEFARRVAVVTARELGLNLAATPVPETTFDASVGPAVCLLFIGTPLTLIAIAANFAPPMRPEPMPNIGKAAMFRRIAEVFGPLLSIVLAVMACSGLIAWWVYRVNHKREIQMYLQKD